MPGKNFSQSKGTSWVNGARYFLIRLLKLSTCALHWGMSRSGLGVFDAPQSPQFVIKFTHKLFATVCVDLFGCREPVDTMVENVCGHCGSLFIWNGHHKSDFCYAQQVLIAPVCI